MISALKSNLKYLNASSNERTANEGILIRFKSNQNLIRLSMFRVKVRMPALFSSI